jgi:excisionase family DNA binding protein
MLKKTNYFDDSTTIKPDEYCGTSYASKLLRLSVGTIQALAEKNEIHAWKTKGGHRRISMDSIREYQIKHNISIPKNNLQQDDCLRVLLVEDDDVAREMLQSICNNATISVDCTAMSSGMEALIDIASIQPHVLITDLDMPGIDGFELLRILRQNSNFENMAILALSALSSNEIEARGGLSKDCIYMPKPIKADWFNGFFAGVMVCNPGKQKTA